MSEDKPKLSKAQEAVKKRSREIKELKRIGTIEKEIVSLKNKIEKFKKEKKTLLEKYEL